MTLIDRFRGLIPGLAPKPAAKAAPPAAATPAMAGDSRVATTATPEDVAKTLDETGRKAFAALPRADQEAYASAWAVAGSTGRGRMATLLGQGKMGEKDKDGRSLAANLAALPPLKLPQGAPYKGVDTLNQVLTHLTDPSVINQSSRNTCGATTVQYMLLREQPSEYARLVAGLMGPGEVKLHSGDTMKRVYDSVPTDDTNRDDVERVIQSAFMDHGLELRGSYSNAHDDFRYGAREEDGILDRLSNLVATPGNWVTKQIGNQGIAEGKIKDLYEDVTGREAKLVGDLPGGVFLKPRAWREDVWGQLSAAVKAGKEVPADIVLKDIADRPGEQEEHILDQSKMSYQDLMQSHQILITQIEGGRVHYRNPWGYDTSMSETEFRSRLTDGFIPQ